MLRVSALFVCLLLVGTAHAADNWVIVHAGTLLAVPGEAPKSNQSVIIKNGRIEGVRSGFVDAARFGRDAKLIDLSKRFVLPGLIDSHVHLTDELGPKRKLNSVTLSDADFALNATMFARRTLEAGFTTVRNLGSGSGRAVLALRDAIKAGKVPGPRIIAAGSTVTPTGGHGEIHGFRETVLEAFHSSATCDGADDCRRAVRAQVKRGSDVIKITATGGVLSETAAGTGQQFTDDELKTIIETAHALGRKVAAHAHGADGVNAALRAGVDSIEHGTYLDNESIKLFKKTGAYLVPTMLAGETVATMASNSTFMPPAIKAKALQVGPRLKTMGRRAYEGGVKMAFGTDSGVSQHGMNGRELVILKEIGIPEADVIVMATIHAADLLGLSGEVGKIEPGMAADLIATAGSPLENIEELTRVIFVMRDGTVH
ncbi:MAG: amidohydrolase family protein [Sphingomonadales bacterium]